MKTLAFFFWLGALACGIQGCDAIITAGGWSLFWTIGCWRFGELVLTSIGSALWRAK